MKARDRGIVATMASWLMWISGPPGRLLGGICLLGAIWMAGAAISNARNSGESVDCSECHVCPRPSKTDPCLKSGLCARHAAMEGLSAELGPEVVILRELENVYGPTRFDHAGHAHMATMDAGCEICHHFTPPTAEHPACKTCHPKEVAPEDVTQPGLRSAYHRSCMACHHEWDREGACEVCHAKNVAGQPSAVPEQRHYPPLELPGMIVYTIESDDEDTVPFHHGNHSEAYEPDCAACHQQQSCGACHIRSGERHPMGPPGERDLHTLCFRCHDGESCDDCHGLDPEDIESAGD